MTSIGKCGTLWLFLFALVSLGRAQRTVCETDNFRLIEAKVDGFSTISVVGEKTVYGPRRTDAFLKYALPWRVGTGKKQVECFLIAYEYGAGSTNLLTVLGPGKNGRWGELLHVDCRNAHQFQPQFTDLVGDGIVDILTMKELRVGREKGASGDDLGGSTIEIWRWSWSDRTYRRVETTLYRRRFDASRKRT